MCMDGWLQEIMYQDIKRIVFKPSCDWQMLGKDRSADSGTDAMNRGNDERSDKRRIEGQKYKRITREEDGRTHADRWTEPF